MVNEFLTALRESADIQYCVFTQGSCFRLYQILKIIEPKAEAYWSDLDNHCITKIDGKFYDIGGEVSSAYITDCNYNKIPKKQLKGYALLKYTTDATHQPNVTVQKYI